MCVREYVTIVTNLDCVSKFAIFCYFGWGTGAVIGLFDDWRF